MGIAAYWDEGRTTDAALADFGASQATVAASAVETVRAVADGAGGGGADLREELRPRLMALERLGQVRILLRLPGLEGLQTLHGAPLRSSPIEARFAAGLDQTPWVRLTHEQAAALGLPSRTAMVGLAEVDVGARGKWGIAVAATAIRERDREERSLWHVALSFALTLTTIVTFGTLALRRQRTELELAQRLAIAEAIQVRDERLVRADKLATLGAMALGIAHQVATPLGVITARAERLAPRVAGDEKASRAVCAIRDQARRINEIIRAFLQLARGGSPTLVHTSPATLARGAAELVGHRFEKAQVALRLALGEDLPMIACDPRLFEQVVVNLLLNACDACSAGGHVTLTVQATDRTVSFEGTGLGLAIAQEIIGHHHGTFELRPLAGKGTMARVEIPLPAGPVNG
jgi:signal transduction histidine kinase